MHFNRARRIRAALCERGRWILLQVKLPRSSRVRLPPPPHPRRALCPPIRGNVGRPPPPLHPVERESESRATKRTRVVASSALILRGCELSPLARHLEISARTTRPSPEIQDRGSAGAVIKLPF